MLKIRDVPCLLGKFSNNLDKHGEDDLTAFDVPISMELKRPSLNALVEDKEFDKRVFGDAEKGKPMPVASGFEKFAPLKFRDAFEDAHVELTLDNKTLSFDGCRITKITCDFCLGGMTEVNLSVHIKPANDREILLLLHNQRRKGAITISGGKLVVVKAQQDLELGPPEEGGDDDGGSNGGGKDPRPVGGVPDSDNVRPLRP